MQSCWQVRQVKQYHAAWRKFKCKNTFSNSVTPAAAREHYATYVEMETYYSLPHSSARGKHTLTQATNTQMHMHVSLNPGGREKQREGENKRFSSADFSFHAAVLSKCLINAVSDFLWLSYIVRIY